MAPIYKIAIRYHYNLFFSFVWISWPDSITQVVSNISHVALLLPFKDWRLLLFKDWIALVQAFYRTLGMHGETFFQISTSTVIGIFIIITKVRKSTWINK